LEERRIQVSGVPLEPRDEAVSPTPRLALSLEDFVLFALRAWPWLPPPRTTDAMQPSEQTFHVTSAFYHRLLTKGAFRERPLASHFPHSATWARQRASERSSPPSTR